ncbi:heavy metal translocating P-type ATPase [Pseudoramibacter sp.]|jgi:heavy metal translocating P-type ATPase|uniref:heavy metal translocating P-type ATPase n=1 Tax=Pseudoramibacter sp. TaxID=2034862 RepID=UPI0025D2B8B3|nr:cation-translocating P-type ATPase [Pseudoramibacter sp.]MCH4072226.1 cadmium-translocating P-type ATPase [Pseudoramibacter sp.]MCH4105996.1 cadmium-translocating P-type ATPase [Pseudoramibacter sp.]
MIKKWLTNEPKPTLVCVIASGIALALSLINHFHPLFSVFDPAWIAAVLCGIPIIVGAAVALVTKFDITADLLVTLALLASLFTKEWFAAGEVAFIMQIGSLLEDYTSDRARQGISALINLTPKVARVVKDGVEKVVPVEAIAVGDTLSILAGETIPVDGVLTSGQTSVNQAAMTGESVPVEKETGDELLSGTINQAHPIQMRVDKVSGDSTLQRMINLAKEADANKAPIVSLADKWATWMVLVALGCAVAVGLLTGMFSRAVTVLVVFCPCAFVLATPTAVAAAIGNLTHYGILVKSGDALERLSGVDTIAFDKTGTLTQGHPAVTEIVSLDSGRTEEALLKLAASVEHYSEHPFGKAIVAAYHKRTEDALLSCEKAEVRQGEGIQAEIDGQTVLVGKASLFPSDAVQAESRRIVASGSTPIAVAVSGEPVGLIALADPIREEAKTTVAALKNLGLHPVMLTGDRQTIAEKIAEAVGIDEVHSELMPGDKMAYLKDMAEKGHHVAMTGDGINDALALSSAYAGIAMGSIGSDIAVESASAVLVSDDLKGLLGLFDMSHQCMRKIKQNIVVAMILNFTAIVLSGLGLLVPITGALWHNCGSVFVVINAALLLRKKHDYA